MKIILFILFILHGLIHLLGFVKAFNFAPVGQLTQNISKINGILWLVTATLFVTGALLFLLEKDSWWMFPATAILISQYLIIVSWQDAKFGTIANVIMLLATVVGFSTWSFIREYRKEAAAGRELTSTIPDTIVTENDILHLPAPVQKYLHYTGVVGKPRVKNFKIRFVGQIRKNEQSPWMPFTSEQYNFMNASTRLFFMNATMEHLPVAGFHRFNNGDAFMDIRLLSLVRVQYQSGKEMAIAETVTFFNDMCCMAPATLMDKRIEWLEVNGNNVRAAFTNNGITISAWLYFNERGELMNFVSEDRYAADDNKGMRKLRWSTPLKDYKEFGGYRLAGYADAIYTYPGGDLIYGNFRLASIEYNCK